MGGSIAKVVSALVEDIINPVLGIMLGSMGSLDNAELTLAGSSIKYGHFIGVLIDFVIISLVVYFIFKKLADKLDKKK